MNKKNTMNDYKEIKMDAGGFEKRYKNPLTKQYQREYALFLAVSELFAVTVSRSMCIESLMLYYKELSRETQEDLLEEMRPLVASQISGHVTFPMMHICAAEVRAHLEKDGTHTFSFSDGIYGFSVHMDKPKRNERIHMDVHP